MKPALMVLTSQSKLARAQRTLAIDYPDHISGFTAALAAAGTTQTAIGWFGHSVIEGAYANDATINSDSAWNRLGCVAVLRDLMATRFGPCTSQGTMHPASNVSVKYFVGGGAAVEGGYLSAGLGGYRINLSTSAKNVSFAITGRYLRVYGFATTAGVTARYQIDGGSITDASASSSGLTTNGAYWYTFDVDMGTDASHNVVLWGAASGAWYLLSATGFATTTTGVAVHRFGMSGMTLPDLLASSLDGTDVSGPGTWLAADANYKTQQLQSVTSQLGLGLAVITVDANDLTRGVTYGYSLADIKRHAQNAADAIVAQGIDVLFVTGPYRTTSSHAASFTQDEVIQQYADVAEATSGVAHLNVAAAFPDYSGFNSAGAMHDVVHLTSKGHKFLGTTVFNALMRLV